MEDGKGTDEEQREMRKKEKRKRTEQEEKSSNKNNSLESISPAGSKRRNATRANSSLRSQGDPHLDDSTPPGTPRWGSAWDCPFGERSPGVQIPDSLDASVGGGH
ncbi:hypothetical protein P170DRAFT_194920 [Aspergillus steynii IBT 23096]|uniref:Uncharacterized protein n=1 Tax=Aspergillus steynii IBT 23096 TaxID=1392250 RepID=A0A2I2G404_9EURO|nr:uncharacterized protein P170DRAFT_194920 [Aspergillus steynii IBT 23096]PLB47589.1 hypothetical protein P170DRAFT_194920 [Aspergillus steynii IBT 23096]